MSIFINHQCQESSEIRRNLSCMIGFLHHTTTIQLFQKSLAVRCASTFFTRVRSGSRKVGVLKLCHSGSFAVRRMTSAAACPSPSTAKIINHHQTQPSSSNVLNHHGNHSYHHETSASRCTLVNTAQVSTAQVACKAALTPVLNLSSLMMIVLSFSFDEGASQSQSHRQADDDSSSSNLVVDGALSAPGPSASR